jgi:nitrite reductase (NADH) small subunit
MTDAPPRTRWVTVCEAGVLTPDRGRAARVGDEVVAVFALADGSVFAVDDRDPFTDAHVMSRGIVGDADGTPTVASPVYKQRFELGTGRCLEDDTVALRTWPVRLQEGWVQVAVP